MFGKAVGVGETPLLHVLVNLRRTRLVQYRLAEVWNHVKCSSWCVTLCSWMLHTCHMEGDLILLIWHNDAGMEATVVQLENISLQPLIAAVAS